MTSESSDDAIPGMSAARIAQLVAAALLVHDADLIFEEQVRDFSNINLYVHEMLLFSENQSQSHRALEIANMILMYAEKVLKLMLDADDRRRGHVTDIVTMTIRFCTVLLGEIIKEERKFLPDETMDY